MVPNCCRLCCVEIVVAYRFVFAVENLHLKTLIIINLSTVEINTGLFISPSGISELDCATTKTDTAERSISIGRESLQVFFLY